MLWIRPHCGLGNSRVVVRLLIRLLLLSTRHDCSVVSGLNISWQRRIILPLGANAVLRVGSNSILLRSLSARRGDRIVPLFGGTASRVVLSLRCAAGNCGAEEGRVAPQLLLPAILLLCLRGGVLLRLARHGPIITTASVCTRTVSAARITATGIAALRNRCSTVALFATTLLTRVFHGCFPLRPRTDTGWHASAGRRQRAIPREVRSAGISIPHRASTARDRVRRL
jgi:hypothetical protein